jgi:RNA polymerase sigma-70 factor (ECF subfamily)
VEEHPIPTSVRVHHHRPKVPQTQPQNLVNDSMKLPEPSPAHARPSTIASNMSGAFEPPRKLQPPCDFRGGSVPVEHDASDGYLHASVNLGLSTLSKEGDVQLEGQMQNFAQPQQEVGVNEDMSTLVINSGPLDPTDLGTDGLSPIRLDCLADAQLPESRPLHRNGDFAEMDDAAIMLELKAGNMAGFDFLIQKYRKPIISFMYRMTRNQAVAEELAQEVFLRVYRSRETYRAEARFSTWLYRIATNLGVNQARDTRHERAASTIYLDEADSETGTTPDVADTTPDVESKLLRNERMAAIREHVMALPERQKMAVLMHKYEGMDYSQIGDVLKLSESATKSLLFRAYQTLREKLKGFV